MHAQILANTEVPANAKTKYFKTIKDESLNK